MSTRFNARELCLLRVALSQRCERLEQCEMKDSYQESLALLAKLSRIIPDGVTFETRMDLDTNYERLVVVNNAEGKQS
jgi:hypothetical protein